MASGGETTKRSRASPRRTRDDRHVAQVGLDDLGLLKAHNLLLLRGVNRGVRGVWGLATGFRLGSNEGRRTALRSFFNSVVCLRVMPRPNRLRMRAGSSSSVSCKLRSSSLSRSTPRYENFLKARFFFIASICARKEPGFSTAGRSARAPRGSRTCSGVKPSASAMVSECREICSHGGDEGRLTSLGRGASRAAAQKTHRRGRGAPRSSPGPGVLAGETRVALACARSGTLFSESLSAFGAPAVSITQPKLQRSSSGAPRPASAPHEALRLAARRPR